MLGLDDHLDLAKAWGDLAAGWAVDWAADCMMAAGQASTAVLAPFAQSRSVFSPAPCTAASPSSDTRVNGWYGTSAEPGPTSWYREPTRSPFEPWPGLAWSMPPATAAFAPPQAMLDMLQTFQAWTRLLAPTPPGIPTPINWMGWPSPASLPIAALPWMIGMGFTMAASVPARAPTGGPGQFATYRSDSGHAVAQITFPNDVVAAIAVPTSTVGLFDAFFPWSRVVHR